MASAELELPFKPSQHHPLIRTALIHRLQRPLEAGLAAVAQRDERLAELLAAGFDAQARVVADTVDGAEDAVDRRQQRVDAGNRFAQAPVMVDQFGIEIAGDLAQMRHLAVSPADIEKALRTGRCLLLYGRVRRLRAIILLAPNCLLLFFPRHASPCR